MRRRSNALLLAALALALSACGNGQLVDAAGERGGGGLAFVAMCIMVFAFAAALFWADRVRSRKSDE